MMYIAAFVVEIGVAVVLIVCVLCDAGKTLEEVNKEQRP